MSTTETPFSELPREEQKRLLKNRYHFNVYCTICGSSGKLYDGEYVSTCEHDSLDDYWHCVVCDEYVRTGAKMGDDWLYCSSCHSPVIYAG